MSKCLVHARECVDFVDTYQNWKDQDCPWCRIGDLAAELAEVKAQRDSWKRIAESGLGITAETPVSISESGTVRRSVRDMVFPRSESETKCEPEVLAHTIEGHQIFGKCAASSRRSTI